MSAKSHRPTAITLPSASDSPRESGLGLHSASASPVAFEFNSPPLATTGAVAAAAALSAAKEDDSMSAVAAEVVATATKDSGFTSCVSSAPSSVGTPGRVQTPVQPTPQTTAGSATTTNAPRHEPDYLQMILTARVYDIAKETPLTHAVNVSNKYGVEMLLKREDLQPVFSFKLRGAYNRIHHLSAAEKAAGVIACSAGNHAQGVAMAARHLGIRATIVMPQATPDIKVRAVRRLGGDVVLHGNDFDEAKRECARLAVAHQLTNIPPFDDPYVIAGQGTVGVEILRQHDIDKIDAIFCAVGGGGLIAGISSYVKRIAPHIRVIGVETVDADALHRSLAAGRRVELDEVGLFADGTAVRVLGDETYRLCQQFVDEVVLVSTDEICAAIKDVFEDTRSIVEPSGALSLAGAKKWVLEHGRPGAAYVSVLSGANMNFDRLRFVAERAQIGEQREALITAIIPEQPGSFLTMHCAIDPRQITEFSYRYSNSERAYIFAAFTVQEHAREVTEVCAALTAAGMQGMDITHNEMAKSHARYLIGGRSKVADERLYRFVFPERPFALRKFLQGIQSTWNISLFHYRYVGGDYGHILVGIQVPPEQYEAFEAFLSQLNYPYVEETDNIVYQQFLC